MSTKKQPAPSPKKIPSKKLCQKAGKTEDEKNFSPEAVAKVLKEKQARARYKLSFDKILRMYRKLIRDQFVTFAEA